MKSWRNIEYLKCGNSVQKNAFLAINKLGILDDLKTYDPILVGTIPIGIDIEGSDLDIICGVDDFEEFQDLVNKYYGSMDGFRNRMKHGVGDNKIFICNFMFMNFEFEIYASSGETESFNGYRHMVIEHRILNICGENFRKKIIQLKKSGIKTEPAFARLLGIDGDPYDGLLEFEGMEDSTIKCL